LTVEQSGDAAKRLMPVVERAVRERSLEAAGEVAALAVFWPPLPG
jgi:hypothetical protein